MLYKRRPMKPKVYITRAMSKDATDMIAQVCDVEVNVKDAPATRDELIENIRDKGGIICMLTDRIDKEVMDAAPMLKVISTMSVGFEHIDVEEATKRGIYIGNTPGVLTDATADLTFALILATARHIPQADRFVRQGEWKISWSPSLFLGKSLWGATLGIIGFGRIGRAVAKRAKGFNMNVLYNSRTRIPRDEEKRLGVRYATLDTLLKRSDFVTIHTPLTKDTYHIIDEGRLRLMKRDAILINTSRGATVDEASLARALKEGWIAGAGLDVFQKEPIQMDNPLIGLDNVVLLPHIGSATSETRRMMAHIAAKNLLLGIGGEKPLYCVNPEAKRGRSKSGI